MSPLSFTHPNVVKIAVAMTLLIPTATALSDQSDRLTPLGLPKEFTDQLTTSLESTRNQQYGSVHYIVQRTLTHGDEQPTCETIEYWSRDNRYFRVDRRKHPGKNFTAIDSQEILIVRPEGYAMLHAQGDSLQPTVHTIGTAAEGMNLLLALPTVHGSTRAYSIIQPEMLLQPVGDNGGHRKLINYSIEGRTLRWSTNFSMENRSTDASIVCDIDAGVCLSYEAEMRQNGQPTIHVSAAREYNNQEWRPIPDLETITITHPEKRPQIDSRITKSVDWTPVDISVFLPPGPQPSGQWDRPWARRLLLGLVGTCLVIAWLYVRKTHSTRPTT